MEQNRQEKMEEAVAVDAMREARGGKIKAAEKLRPSEDKKSDRQILFIREALVAPRPDHGGPTLGYNISYDGPSGKARSVERRQAAILRTDLNGVPLAVAFPRHEPNVQEMEPGGAKEVERIIRALVSDRNLARTDADTVRLQLDDRINVLHHTRNLLTKHRIWFAKIEGMPWWKRIAFLFAPKRVFGRIAGS